MIQRTLVVITLLCLISIAQPACAEGSFITLHEVTEAGRSLPLPSDRFLYNVDINSIIEIRLHPAALVETTSPGTETGARLAKEVESLRQLLAVSSDHLHDYVSSLDTLYSQMQKAPTPALEKEFRQQLANHGVLIMNLLDVLEPVVGTKVLDEALNTPDPLYSDLFTLLTTHIKDVQKRLSAENQRVLDENKLTINLWCIHQSQTYKPTAVHLPNYDNLESGAVQMVNKFALSPEDQAHLRESLKFHEDLRDMLTELPDQKAEIEDLLDELRKQLEASLNKFQAIVNLDELQRILGEAQDALKQVSANPELNELQQCIDDLNSTYTQFCGLPKAFDSLRQTLSTWGTTDPLMYYSALEGQLTAFLSQVEAVFNPTTQAKITGLAEKLETYLLAEANQFSGELQKQLASLPKNTKEWAADLTTTRIALQNSQIFTDLDPAMSSLLSRLSFTAVLQDVPVTTGVPEEIRQVALSDALPTTIDLLRTQRQAGDTFTLYVKALREHEVEFQQEYTFRVKRYGAYTAWNSSLIFVKGVGQEVFQPATGISWIMHYRPRTEGGWSVPFLTEVLNPGIGLNSTMFYVTDQIEYGLGVTVTLFNDFVQVGYGINFQRTDTEGRGYFFIGAALFDFLKQNPGVW